MRPFMRRCGALPRSSQISLSLLQRSWYTGRRCYSIKPEAASTSVPQDVDASKLVIETVKTPSQPKKNEELIFGQTFTGQTCMPTHPTESTTY